MSNKKHTGLVRPVAGLMALEQRFMFDGAALADASATVSKSVATDAGLLQFAHGAEKTTPALDAAQKQAEQAVMAALQQPNALTQLFTLFNGGQNAPSAAWLQAAQDLIAKVNNGGYSVQVELRSNTEMAGAMGAFAAQGEKGTAVIYLNADWLQMGPNAAAIERVLVEEIGHSLDAVLNGSNDTAGDEGDAFAIQLLGTDAAGSARVGANDRAVLSIDGVQVQVEEASVTFKAAYQGTPSAWSLQASSITLTSQLAAASGNIKFISADPSALYYAGNNVAGNLTYTDNSGVVHTISGVVSRQFKTGGTTNAFYFYATGANGLVDVTGGDDSAYLLQVLNDTASYTTGTLYRTSSDPVDTALNAFRDNPTATVAPTLTAASSTSANATAALELGTSAGHDGTGNVLDASLVAGFGTGLNVISVGTSDGSTQSSVTSSTTSANGTVVHGVYGDLTIGANGTYKYLVTNTNATVNALRLSTDTLTDTFTYTAKDSSGKVASTTLTVTIQGQNDAPVAVNDYNTTKIGGTAVTGNVLSNDSDVDKGDVLSISQLAGSATATGISNTAGGTSLAYTTSNGYSSVHNGDYVYYWNASASKYELVHDAAGNAVTITNTATTTLSATPTQYYTSSGWVNLSSLTNAQLGFNTVNSGTPANENTTNLKYIVVTSSTSTASSTFSVSNLTGSIAVGMSASGTGVAAGTTVKSITYDTNGNPVSVTLDNTITTANNGTISFSAAAGSTLTGHYGTLVLNSNGTYTYTPNSTGTGGTDVFSYTAQDLAGATASATLNIQVLAAAATLTTVADAKSITVGTASVSDNVITNTIGISGNDTSTGGAETIINGATASAALGTTQTIASGGSQDIVGQYGTLHLSSNGAYTYTLKTDATSVSTFNALGSNATLTDSFQYLATNATSGAKSAAPLTITINGVNDAPTLQLNTSGAGGTNFVTSFTQGSVSTPLTTLTGTHIADVDDTYFSKLTVALTQSNFPDGSSEQLLINGATGTNTTIGNLAALTSASTGSFTLGGVTYTYSTAVSGGVATLSFRSTTALTQTQAETLLTALRYQNTSTNPTAGSSRVFTLAVTDDATSTSNALASSGTLTSNTATATITVYNTSTAPIATADTVTATEAGVSAGVDPTGSLLTGETSNSTGTNIGDSGASITVTKASTGSTLSGAAPSVVAGSTALSNATAIQGAYGTLTIGADGTYKYTVDNANATVNALQAGSSINEVFSYQITDNQSRTATAKLTVTINGANDAPTASNTSISTLFNTAKVGTLPAYTDPDTGDTVAYAVGTAAHGTVTLANGQYTYTPTTGYSGSDSFTYTVTDNHGASNTYTVTVTVNPNSPPVLDLDGSTAGYDYGAVYHGVAVAIANSNDSVTDSDNANMVSATIVLTAKAGDTLTVGTLPTGITANNTTLTANADGTLTLTLSGSATKTSYATALHAITFSTTSTDTTNRALTVKVNDGSSDSNVANTTIQVLSATAVSVNDISVNEASPYAVFTVTGPAAQTVTLALQSTGTGTGYATLGTDTANAGSAVALQYLNSSNAWTDYTGAVALDAGGHLLVRTRIQNDQVYEGPETFKLVVTNTATNLTNTTSSGNNGIATIYDNGTGDVYLDTNTSGTPNAATDTSYHRLPIES